MRLIDADDFLYMLRKREVHTMAYIEYAMKKSEPENIAYAFTEERLQKLINEVACDVGGGGCYGEYLVCDYDLADCRVNE